MNRTFTAAVAALIFAVGFAGSVVAGPSEESYARVQQSLAERGDARSQTFLGVLYAKGHGVIRSRGLSTTTAMAFRRTTSSHTCGSTWRR
jgi:hypothetical protein